MWNHIVGSFENKINENSDTLKGLLIEAEWRIYASLN